VPFTPQGYKLVAGGLLPADSRQNERRGQQGLHQQKHAAFHFHFQMLAPKDAMVLQSGLMRF
jgi:hypothetical protein